MKKDTKAKEVKKTKKVGVKITPKKAIKFNTDDTIIRPGYTIRFIKNDNEAAKNEIANSGKVFGVVAYTGSTPNDQTDELIYFLKN